MTGSIHLAVGSYALKFIAFFFMLSDKNAFRCSKFNNIFLPKSEKGSNITTV